MPPKKLRYTAVRKILLPLMALFLGACAAHSGGVNRLAYSSGDHPSSGAALIAASVLSSGETLLRRAALPSSARSLPGDLPFTPALRVPFVAQELAVSPRGQWFALVRQDEKGLQAELWEFSAQQKGEPRWVSPVGCGQPRFAPSGKSLVLACTARRGQPPALLLLDVQELKARYLVGERARSAPAFGAEGDLYWVEEYRGEFVVIRHPRREMPYGTHRLDVRPQRLWPQEDGAIWAGPLSEPGSEPWLRLEPCGLVRYLDGPIEIPDRPGRGLQGFGVVLDRKGWIAGVGCEGAECTVQFGRGDRVAELRWPGDGRPQVLAFQIGPGGRVERPEDLATAPGWVFRQRSAPELGVLGVAIGTRLDEAFAHLDRGGRNPYWMGTGPRRSSPRGIGVGWARGQHCIEFGADDRGRVEVVDLRACAARYLSPPLQGLLDGRRFREGPQEHVEAFLGTGLLLQVEAGPKQGSPGVQLRRLRFELLERGYVLEAESHRDDRRRPGMVRDRLLLRLRGAAPPRGPAALAPRVP